MFTSATGFPLFQIQAPSLCLGIPEKSFANFPQTAGSGCSSANTLIIELSNSFVKIA
jgi:hypothetical protein